MRHQTDERAHGSANRCESIVQGSHGEHVRVSSPLNAQVARPTRATRRTTAGTPQNGCIPAPQPSSLSEDDTACAHSLGVPALKDAPRSTSTSALHRHRPVRNHDAGHGRAAAPRTWEALGVRQKSTSTPTFRDPEELLRMALLLTHHPQRSPEEHLRSTFTYVDLSEEGRSVHFYVIFTLRNIFLKCCCT